MTEQDIRESIVIGSGPAGYTAAIYLARANLKPLVFEGAVTAGGALMNTTDVENFPGFPDGIMGPTSWTTCASRPSASAPSSSPTTSPRSTYRLYQGRQGRGDTYYARAVVLAMGSAYRELGVPSEKRLSGHGVSWCATCDGFFFRDKDIAVVGGGDSAMEEATFLTRFASSVTSSTAATACAPPRSCRTARSQREDLVRLGHRGARRRRRRRVTRLRCATLDRRGARPRRQGVFIAIGHDPRSPSWSPTSLRSTPRVRAAASARLDRDQPAGRVRRPATWSTTPTARPSPRPAPAAPRPSMPSASSPPSRKMSPSCRVLAAPRLKFDAGQRHTPAYVAVVVTATL